MLIGVAFVLAVLAAGGASAAAGPANSDALLFSHSALIPPAHARRLPSLPVPPLDLGSEAAGANPLVPGSLLTTVAPTPLIRGGYVRTPQAAFTSPNLGGPLAGLSNPGTIGPADVQLAVGPSDVVEMVNSSVELWTKTGQLETTESLGDFFTSSGADRRQDEMTDPRVIYDAQSGRWFSTVLDLTRDEVVMVISPTAQPGSQAWIYDFPSSGCQDQPRLGVSDGMVAFGDNLFSQCPGGGLLGGELTVLDKNDLMSGATVNEQTYGPDPFFSSVTPVVSLSSTGTLYFVSTDFLSGAVDLFSTSAVQPGPLPVTRIPVHYLAQAPDALQSDPQLVSTGDNRVQNAVWENGHLWLAISDGCLVTGESGVHACARYVEINTQSMSAEMDAGMALDQNRDLYYPAVMPTSDGLLYSVFGYSSASETPSIGVTINPQDLSGWETLTAGTGADESGRWGDYFGIARDPSDPTKVWVAAAYGTGGDAWGTTVAALGSAPFSITPPVSAPPASPPVRTAPAVTHPKAKPKRKKRAKRH